jgi:hypothetical protein
MKRQQRHHPHAQNRLTGRVVTPWSRVIVGSFCRHVQVRDNDSNDS